MKTLVIVHTESSIRESLSYLFRNEGYTVHGAGDVGLALELCRSEQPHVVITGLSAQWVQGNALDLVPVLRREFPSLVIVTLSGDGAKGTVDRAKSMGATHHFYTPIHFPDVLNVVRLVAPNEADPTL